MKIVDVCAFYAPQGGGVKTYVDRKLKVGAAMGQDIVIIAPGKHTRTEERPEGGRIHYIASPQLIVDRRYRYFQDRAAVHTVLDAEQPDIVEASSPWRTASIVADWPGNAPRALIMHADPLAAYAYRWFGQISSREAIDHSFDFFWRYLRRLSARFDTVISANDSLSQRLKDGGVAGVATLPMGVDPHIFSPQHKDADLRRALLASCDLSEDATLLLAVGRHSAEKRWPMVIDACIAAGHQRPIGLVLIGDGRDRAKIVRHTRGNPHIHLCAPVRDRATLAAVMASADALIHGCEAETFGLVAAEAVASGLPLIVPSEGGASALVAPSTGETYQTGDSVSAAEAILRFCNRDQNALRAATCDAAVTAPTIDDHFTRLFDHYSGLNIRARQAA